MGILFQDCCKKKKYHKEINIFGLKNLGNTCFMNSSLQCLLHSKKLIDNLNYINQYNIKARLTNEILIILQKIKDGERIVNPVKIKDILSEVEEKYKYNEQNDANEFITIFLNYLLKELNGQGIYKPSNIPFDELEKKGFDRLENRFFLKNKSFLLNLFYGRLKREYICENGHLFNVKFNNYNTLILPHPDKSNDIIDLLKLYQNEKLINDEIFCDDCNAKVKYSIKTTIYNIPEYFILCIEKEQIHSFSGLNYPRILETKEFMNNDSSKYSLFSLIVYSGDRERGHYTAKCFQNNDLYHISDSYYKKVDEREINDKNSIILFYEKI